MSAYLFDDHASIRSYQLTKLGNRRKRWGRIANERENALSYAVLARGHAAVCVVLCRQRSLVFDGGLRGACSGLVRRG